MCAVKSQLRAMAAQCRFVQLAWSHTSIPTTHLQPLSSPCASLGPWDTPPTTSVATRDVYYPGLMYGMPAPTGSLTSTAADLSIAYDALLIYVDF